MATNDEFMERVTAEIRTLDARGRELAVKEAEIRLELAEIRTRLADLSRLAAVYSDFMGLTKAVELDIAGLFPEEEPTPPKSLNGAEGTVADLSASIISAHGGRMKVADLVAELTRMGKMPGGKYDYGSVFGALKRNPKRFVKVGPGEFANAPASGPGQPS